MNYRRYVVHGGDEIICYFDSPKPLPEGQASPLKILAGWSRELGRVLTLSLVENGVFFALARCEMKQGLDGGLEADIRLVG